jgi:hypothetical protein
MLRPMFKLNKFKRRIAMGIACALLYGVASDAFATEAVSYNREIRPLLAKHCWACHGPDEGTREADLRLDLRDAATTDLGGHFAIRPGAPEQSELMVRVASRDPDLRMPPEHAGPPLTESQVDLLQRWIAEGANFETHWAFVPPNKPELPNLTQEQTTAKPIDIFVMAKLKEVNLSLSPPADRATQLRRVFFDLIGIPPSPEQVDAFVGDTSPQAYERVVDALLSQPEFGEKWGRAWLDLARYSDTNGYEKDRPRSIWLYRDWVIKAINDDMPFDTFTVQQLAGDMLSPPDPEAKIATGMHRNTMLNEEGGIDPLEFRFYAMNDRVATTGLVWMGLTTGCAQCHSHKFDPISHSEYYEFMALLNNADEPDFEFVSANLQAERQALHQKIATLEALLPERFPINADGSDANRSTSNGTANEEQKPAVSRQAFATAFSAWTAEQQQNAVDWKIVVPEKMTTNSPRLESMKDGSLYSTGDITKRDVFELTLTKETLGDQPISALRLEALPDSRLPAGGPGRCYYEGRRGDFFLSEIVLRDGDKLLKVRDASHSYGKNGLGSGSADAKNVFDGDGSTGWSTAQREGEAHQLVLLLDQPYQIDRELKIEMLFERHYAASLGRFRWSVVSTDKSPTAQAMPAPLQSLLARSPESWTSDERQQLERHFALTCNQLAEARKEIDTLRGSVPTAPTTLVMEERPADNPRPTFRHHRGEYLSPREEVQGSLPEIFRQATKHPPRNRLELARWLASRDNPLVGRVYVNRVWQSFFGDGLVRSQGDFGMQSSPPTHPELLDWLAVEWMESGWSLKKLCRDIVLSATYRQSSHVSPELQSVDPENRLLARFSRQRLDAELVRDSMLSASGLLSQQIGGESVRPPQPASVTALAYGNGAWAESKGADRYRRSLYTYSKRTAPFAALAVFDGPSGETCTVSRNRSNTPLQALTTLNDQMFIEFAEALGCEICDKNSSTQSRAVALASTVWSRPPTQQEIEAIVNYVEKQIKRLNAAEVTPQIQTVGGERIRQRVAQDPQVLAWILAARAILNTDEAIVKP